MQGLLKSQSIVVLLVACAASQAQAAFFTGSIQFSGGSFNDTTTLTSSSSLTAFTGTGVGGLPVVQFGSTGTFGAVPSGTTVNFSPFTYTGPGVTLPAPNWQFIAGGETYSFVINAISSAVASAVNIPGVGEQDFLNITGTGFLSIGDSSLAPTLATFHITESGPPNSTTAFNFAESITVVPEPSVLALSAVAALPFALRFMRRANRK